jgi:hypothetical protein
MWPLRLNVLCGSLVVAVGFRFIWGELPLALTAVVALLVVGLLVWRARTIPEVWAWSTLLLGLECLAWPLATMVQMRMETTEPSDQQMGLILTAVIWGFPSGIFWLTFSYGLFKKWRHADKPG